MFAASLICALAASAQTTDFDALLVEQASSKTDDSYPFTETEGTLATVTVDDDILTLAIGAREERQYVVGREMDTVVTCFANTFKIKANQDPDHKENYYSTFYTSKFAYKLPEDGTVKAYIGQVESTDNPDVDALKLTSVGDTIHKGEAVIVKATQSDITLLPSCNKKKPAGGNVLTGTETEIASAPANSYALTLGQHGVGFYQWDGKKIPANKAYLQLSAASKAKAFIFSFADDPTGIENLKTAKPDDLETSIYNLQGVRVNGNYKGIVIVNGKKYMVK